MYRYLFPSVEVPLAAVLHLSKIQLMFEGIRSFGKNKEYQLGIKTKIVNC